MYKVIDLKTFPKRNQFIWFSSFSNPCYGFTVKIDVTNIINYSHQTKTHFFANMLFVITKSLNEVQEMRLREVDGEIRLYDTINPTFTVMKEDGIYDNAKFEMVEDYQSFYNLTNETINKVKSESEHAKRFNDSELYDDYYFTCVPWVTYISMTHPLPNNNKSSSSCPRICWDKYYEENGKYFVNLNITVNHCFVDGKPLSEAFNLIQNNINNFQSLYIKKTI